MSSRRVRLATCSLALALCGSVGGARANDWTLTIEPVRAAIEVDDPLLLRVELENVGRTHKVVFGGFVPPSFDFEAVTVLRFEVVGKKGNPEFVGRMLPGYYGWGPGSTHFKEVPPRSWYGTIIDLKSDPWKFIGFKPGSYRVRAIVEFKAKEWFWQEHEADAENRTIKDLYPQRSLLAGGRVASNEITIEVRATPSPGD